MSFGEALLNIGDSSSTGWVYLPVDRKWDLRSKSAILESDEVVPELEDDPDAGVPEFAKKNGLMQALPVSVVQDIVTNARRQKPGVTMEELVRAFLYYHKHDAFLKLAS